jgi:hypothetical protein
VSGRSEPGAGRHRVGFGSSLLGWAAGSMRHLVVFVDQAARAFVQTLAASSTRSSLVAVRVPAPRRDAPVSQPRSSGRSCG